MPVVLCRAACVARRSMDCPKLRRNPAVTLLWNCDCWVTQPETTLLCVCATYFLHESYEFLWNTISSILTSNCRISFGNRATEAKQTRSRLPVAWHRAWRLHSTTFLFLRSRHQNSGACPCGLASAWEHLVYSQRCGAAWLVTMYRMKTESDWKAPIMAEWRCISCTRFWSDTCSLQDCTGKIIVMRDMVCEYQRSWAGKLTNGTAIYYAPVHHRYPCILGYRVGGAACAPVLKEPCSPGTHL